jgi:predicted RNA-binding Zn-ribbon protein involved in translation (DUF1610 family)
MTRTGRFFYFQEVKMRAIKGRVEFKKIETKSIISQRIKIKARVVEISCPLCEKTFIQSKRKKGGKFGKNVYQIPEHGNCLGAGMIVTV